MEHEEKHPETQENIVFEDLLQYSNQYTYGATSPGRNPGAKKLTVLDLLRLGDEESDQAQKILPHQMNTFIDNLGDVFIKIVELQQMVAQAYKSSLTKDTKKIKKGLEEINKTLQQQKHLIKKTGKIIDKLSH